MSANDFSVLADSVFTLCILAALIATVRMCAKDAGRRGKSPWLVALLVIVFFPVGLLAWLALRPKIVNPDQSQWKVKPNQ